MYAAFGIFLVELNTFAPIWTGVFSYRCTGLFNKTVEISVKIVYFGLPTLFRDLRV